MHRWITALGLLANLVGMPDPAAAQDCIQDEYGRVICGRRLSPYYYQERRPYYGPRYYEPAPQPYVGGGYSTEGYSPPSPRWRTFNGCPPRYTVQDGLCKPYSGR